MGNDIEIPNIDAMENVITFLRNHAIYSDTKIIVEHDVLVGFFKTVGEEKRRAIAHMQKLQNEMTELEKRVNYLTEEKERLMLENSRQRDQIVALKKR